MAGPVSPVYRTELTPLSFLERSAIVWPDKTAIIHGDREISYAEMAAHATRLGNALAASEISEGDRVAYPCPNIPEMP
ncbi:MAG: AMP-binding protein, partial [Actinomycetota bacterium]